MLRIAIINGPNLNLLGKREPSVYGSTSFDEYFMALTVMQPNVQLSCYQSNVEGEIINYIHACIGNADAIIINAGAYTHTSIAIADAISAAALPTIEVHISNVLAREEYRHTSFLAARCIGTISGLGLNGYSLAIQHLVASP